jgi:hypothetical protein
MAPKVAKVTKAAEASNPSKVSKVPEASKVTESWKMSKAVAAKVRSLRTDPYVLAHRYWDYMEEHPRRRREDFNPYLANLLANSPDPDPEDKSGTARAIRYAKEHYECFYEKGDTANILKWLDKAAAK